MTVTVLQREASTQQIGLY